MTSGSFDCSGVKLRILVRERRIIVHLFKKRLAGDNCVTIREEE